MRGLGRGSDSSEPQSARLQGGWVGQKVPSWGGDGGGWALEIRSCSDGGGQRKPEGYPQAEGCPSQACPLPPSLAGDDRLLEAQNSSRQDSDSRGWKSNSHCPYRRRESIQHSRLTSGL